MKLTKIRELKNFPSFYDFIPEKLSDFSTYNLFFAFNGTGKTTLSRFCESLGQGELPLKCKDYNDFQATIVTDNSPSNIQLNNKKLSESPLKGKIRVFNSDFIEENLQFNNAQANSLLCTIGTENIELKTKERKIQKILNLIFSDDTHLQKKMELTLKNIHDMLSVLYKDTAKEYRNSVHIENGTSYTSSHAENGFKDDFSNYLPLKEKDFFQLCKIAIEEPRKSIEFNYNTIEQNFLKSERFDKIKKLLETEFKRSAVTEKEALISWLNQGIQLHKDETVCKFCGKPFSVNEKTERFNRISSLMQKDVLFEKTEEELKQHALKIKALKQFMDGFNFTIKAEDFLSMHEEKAINLLQTLNFSERKIKYIKSLDVIYDKIQEKLLQMDKKIDLDINCEEYMGLELQLQAFQFLVNQNNTDCSQQLKNKNEALLHIKKDIIFKKIDEERKLRKQIDTYEKIEEHWNKIYERMKFLEEEIHNELTNHKLPIQIIQSVCNRVFGDDAFSLNFDKTENAYRILRNNEPAYNMSEGEKTVIAFAYFIASLKDKKSNNTDIIVIDDPISSLDQQFLFNLYSVLTHEILHLKKGYQQFFILTHNFFFFRKVRNFIQQRLKHTTTPEKEEEQDNSNELRIFEIKKEKKGSYIQNASDFICNKEGEYVYLIKELIKIYNSSNNTLYPGVGNIIRRILEIFLSFEEPKTKSIFSAFQNIIRDNPEIKKYLYLNDMVNTESHASIDSVSGQDFDYMNPVGKTEINELFSFIWDIDPNHAKKLSIPKTL